MWLLTTDRTSTGPAIYGVDEAGPEGLGHEAVDHWIDAAEIFHRKQKDTEGCKIKKCSDRSMAVKHLVLLGICNRKTELPNNQPTDGHIG